VIQLLHLLVGLGAIGLADSLARQIKRRQSANVTAQHAGTMGKR
jgi:Rod binding domain-containing protein